MDISNLSVSELKAMAYDQLVAIEQAQANLKVINETINNKNMQEQTPATGTDSVEVTVANQEAEPTGDEVELDPTETASHEPEPEV